jgi:predicted ArsR family transcriptional regulator
MTDMSRFWRECAPPRQVKQELSVRQAIFKYLSERKFGMSRGEIASRLGQPDLSVRDDLGYLRTLGLVATFGHGRGAVWHLKEP